MSADWSTYVTRDILSPGGFRKRLDQLHARMAQLRDQLNVTNDWGIVPVDSPVSPAMMESACQPDGKLLDWSVYRAVLDAACVSGPEIDRTRKLHQQLSRAREVLPKRLGLAADSTLERRGRMPLLELELGRVTTEAGLINHLDALRAKHGWGLRKVAKKLAHFHPEHSVAHSTLAAWFKSDELPSNRPRFEALVQVLLSPDYPGAAGTEAVRLYMNRYTTLRDAATVVPVDRLASDGEAYWRERCLRAEHELRRAEQLLVEKRRVIAEQDGELARLREDGGEETQYVNIA